MKYKVSRGDKKASLCKKLSLQKGYKFTNKLTITLYNLKIADSILTKKINAKFKDILILLPELEDGDEDGANILLIKIETLRNLIMEKYYPFIGKNKAKVYLLKLQEISERINEKKMHKSKVR